MEFLDRLSIIEDDKDSGYSEDESRDQYGYRGSLYNYGCSKCGKVVQTSHSPIIPGCPCGVYHHWDNISEVGSVPYQCTRCGIVVYSSHYPRNCVCRCGGEHHWVRL